MRYPKLNEIPCDREMTSIFGGYNHKLRIAEGEFYDMENLSSDHYPVLSTRQRRGFLRNLDKKITGMIAKDGIYYLAGGDLYALQSDKNDKLIATLGLKGDEMRTLVSMGAKILIYPDLMYVDISTAETGEFGDKAIKPKHNRDMILDGSYIVTSFFHLTLCTEDGETLTNYQGSHSSNPSPYKYEGSGEGYVTMAYTDGDTILNSTENMLYVLEDFTWVEKGVPCFRFNQAEGFGSEFAIGDNVEISGFETCEIEEGRNLTQFNQKTVVVGKNGFDPVFKYVGDMSAYGYSCHCNNPVTVKRLAPKRDFVTENGNRLWGCLYGRDFQEFHNAIFATALGSADRWNTNDGTSMDSYYVNVGTDGAFTGAINYAGKPTFFKDNCMHVVYGDYPANYSLQTITCDGVQAGCDKSLVIIDSVLYYKSRNGIYAYDGSLPVRVSEPLGDMSFYEDGVACGVGQKYYISLFDSRAKKRVMFVLDTLKALWHKEDSPSVTRFCTHKGEVYYLADDDNTRIRTLLSGGNAGEASVNWYAETGIIGVDDPDKKYISRMDVRMSLEIGAKARFFIEYDSSREWEYLFTMTGTSLRTFPIPIRPKRCDHLRLKIEGTGDVKIFSICKNIEKGSDL